MKRSIRSKNNEAKNYIVLGTALALVGTASVLYPVASEGAANTKVGFSCWVPKEPQMKCPNEGKKGDDCFIGQYSIGSFIAKCPGGTKDEEYVQKEGAEGALTAEVDPIYELDDDGKPKKDKNGNPIIVYETDAQGKPKMDKDGKPILKKRKCPSTGLLVCVFKMHGGDTGHINQWSDSALDLNNPNYTKPVPAPECVNDYTKWKTNGECHDNK